VYKKAKFLTLKLYIKNIFFWFQVVKSRTKSFMIFLRSDFSKVKRFLLFFGRRAPFVEGPDERGVQSDFVKNNFLFLPFFTVLKLAFGNFLFMIF